MDYASGERGDLIDLIAAVHGTDLGEACRWARRWTGLPPVVVASWSVRRATAPTEERYWTTGRALDAWWEPSRPIAGSVAEVYLYTRGISLPDWPETLRWRPTAYHSASGHYLPALVALVTGADGQPAGVQATWLRPDGAGKADLTPARQSYGPVRGGAVRLAEGEPLILAEGVEDALAVLVLARGAGVWSVLGTSGLRAVAIPPELRDVRLAADADAPGRAAAEALAERLTREGRQVRIVSPPAGLKDWNDALREVRS